MATDSHRLGNLAATLLFCMFASCGPQGKVIDSKMPSAADNSYAAHCQRFANGHRADLEKDRYLPPTVQVSQWPAKIGGWWEEAQFVQALAAGQPQRILLTARGGLGKTKLAESIRAQLCAQVPVFIVDSQHVAGSRGEGNPIIAAIAETTKVDVAAAVVQHNGRLLVLLDALDELAPDRRNAVRQAIDDLSRQFPAAQVLVIARPPVLDADYGLRGLDGQVLLPALSCADADAVVAKQFPAQQDRNQLQRFLQKYGMAEQETTATRCNYAYLSTYRDIKKVLEFYQQATLPNSDLLVSRSHAHEALATERLHKELDTLHWQGPAALALVDGMTAAHLARSKTAAIRLQFADCTQAVPRPTVDDTARQVCERVLQSALFVQQPDQSFAFSATGLADLFIARWLDRAMAASKTLDCAVALQHSELLQAGEVFRFLLGQPNGTACLMPLLDDRCSRDKKGDQVEALDDGLPVGRARVRIVKAMHAGYEATHWKFCTQKTLKSMDNTISIP
ncbi:MAG: NACHT domain-containing protein [Myxococcales bacterium]|nr:NACHT domain-containing protein [Myxococcales bacterium]